MILVRKIRVQKNLKIDALLRWDQHVIILGDTCKALAISLTPRCQVVSIISTWYRTCMYLLCGIDCAHLSAASTPCSRNNQCKAWWFWVLSWNAYVWIRQNPPHGSSHCTQLVQILTRSAQRMMCTAWNCECFQPMVWAFTECINSLSLISPICCIGGPLNSVCWDWLSYWMYMLVICITYLILMYTFLWCGNDIIIIILITAAIFTLYWTMNSQMYRCKYRSHNSIIGILVIARVQGLYVNLFKYWRRARGPIYSYDACLFLS